MLIYPIDRPIKQTGHIQIMYGNLAPDGCVGKITGKEGLEFEGPARVFDSEETMLRAVEAGPQKFKVSLSQPELPYYILCTVHDVHVHSFSERLKLLFGCSTASERERYTYDE